MSSSANSSAPALDPPDGVVPDFNDRGRHTVGYTIVILGIIISTASVLPHLANRAMSRKFGLIELLLIAAWVCVALHGPPMVLPFHHAETGIGSIPRIPSHYLEVLRLWNPTSSVECYARRTFILLLRKWPRPSQFQWSSTE